MADQISDAILDAILDRDPYGRVAVETLLTNGLCVIAGEVTTDAYIDIPRVARAVIKDIGYTDAGFGFDYATCGLVTAIQEQSPDIAQGVSAYKKERPEEVGAGDQGLMYGYAVRESPELMPLAITLAHRLARRLAGVRKNGELPWLRPDGKPQVTIEYDGKKPKRIEAVLISAQHAPDIAHPHIEAAIKKHVIDYVLPKRLVDAKTKILVNPTGRFVIGGPKGDTGLTGRKIIVDTYGGRAPHGGGAFSGKDSSKVDRSAAYAARHIAKNLVAAGVAGEVLVQVAYAIGVAQPVSVYVNTFGTAKVKDVSGKV